MGYWYDFQGTLTVEPGCESAAAEAIATYLTRLAEEQYAGPWRSKGVQPNVTGQDLKWLVDDLFWAGSARLNGEDGDPALTFAVDGERKGLLDEVELLAPYLRSLQIDCHGEDEARWRLLLEDGRVRELGGEVVYQGERTLLAAPTSAQPTAPPQCEDEYEVSGWLSIDRSRAEEATETLRAWLSSPAKPRGDVPDLAEGELVDLLDALFWSPVLSYDCDEDGEAIEDDEAIGVCVSDPAEGPIDDGLTVLEPYLRDLRLECDAQFGPKWLIVLAGGRLHYLEGQVTYRS